jgi:sec-independent protein translocase protein TatA
MIGTTEIVVIVAAGLVLFGASAVPKFARSLGQAKKEFQSGLKEESQQEDEEQGKDEKKKTEKE